MTQKYGVFLSHCSADKPAVEAIARRLRDEAGLQPFLDRWHLVPGRNWQQGLSQALANSRTVAVFCGPQGQRGWQAEETQLALLQAARSRNRQPVIPVLLRGARKRDVDGFLRLRTWVDITEPDGFERLVAGIEGRPPVEMCPPLLENSIAARLEEAYRQREELLVLERSTKQIDAEILHLRRKQRRGPTLHANEFLGEGRFRLLEEVGRGGFATVWKAYDRITRSIVAVKVLHGQFAKDESRRERLFRGARRMAELQDANVVRVVEPEGQEQGFYYYVMEYIEGGDLHQAILEKRLNADQRFDVIESIARVLDVAHQRGLVHRDVKPQNILLRDDGTPALTDFDLVQASDSTGGTRTGGLGTVLYASPEQNEDASRVDHRADIYSLGMTAVFCAYGKKLPNEAMFHRERFLASLCCDASVRAALQRAVELRPKDRFKDMAAFAAEIARVRKASVGERAAPAKAKRPPAKVTKKSSRRAGAPAILLPVDPVLDVAVKTGIELVRIPGGTFSMGSPPSEEGRFDNEGPLHEVTLVEFYMARTPVTNAQYRRFMNATPTATKPRFWGSTQLNLARQPVVGVSWSEAMRFCRWAGLELPTEAQWEFACRARTTTRYYSGDDERDLAAVGWYDGVPDGRLHPVAELKPNDYGLYDMHGNVWEWCRDAYESYEVAPRPDDGLRKKPDGCAERVLRGGSFMYSALDARSAARGRDELINRSVSLGFRPVLVLPPSE